MGKRLQKFFKKKKLSSKNDGQGLVSEKQHPLLLPVVMDNLFSYLTFSEVKNSRLVCKAWSEVGIPFIGRRKLKPVNFPDVYFEDYIALKKEFEDPSKPHPKLKLFQGFRLTWEEVVIMAYCNFMPSFKISQLIISGKDFNAPTSLKKILQTTVATLRDLSLEIELDKFPSCYFSFNFLQDLVELGMNLKRLEFKITKLLEPRGRAAKRSNEGSIIYRNVSNLLQNQAPFLEILELIIIRSDRDDFKIEFPAFPRLKFLALFLTLNLRVLPFDFCVKIPNLANLNLYVLTLYEMAQDGGTLDMTRGHPLKELNIFGSESEFEDFTNVGFNKLRISFPFLEQFFAQQLITNGVKIPWADTLRKLEIRGTSHEYNFLHLKKIEKLHYTMKRAQVIKDVNGFINRLLEHYYQLPLLEEFHLSGFKISPEQMIQILEKLPAGFWAILTID